MENSSQLRSYCQDILQSTGNTFVNMEKHSQLPAYGHKIPETERNSFANMKNPSQLPSYGQEMPESARNSFASMEKPSQLPAYGQNIPESAINSFVTVKNSSQFPPCNNHMNNFSQHPSRGKGVSHHQPNNRKTTGNIVSTAAPQERMQFHLQTPSKQEVRMETSYFLSGNQALPSFPIPSPLHDIVQGSKHDSQKPSPVKGISRRTSLMEIL